MATMESRVNTITKVRTEPTRRAKTVGLDVGVGDAAKEQHYLVLREVGREVGG